MLENGKKIDETSHSATILCRKDKGDYFPQNFVCILRTITTRHKFHRFLFPFSSKLLDLNFAPYWGARNGAVVRALASHQCGPGSNPGVDAICGLSLLLVLSLAPRGFSPGTPIFPSPQKPTFSNSNSTRNQVDEEPLCGCATSKSLFIFHYLFIYYLYVRYIYSCDEPRT